MLIQGGTDWLTARSDHSQAVVLKISEAVGAPLNKLHFPMEAFGNAIVFREPPHGRNLAGCCALQVLFELSFSDAFDAGNPTASELFGSPISPCNGCKSVDDAGAKSWKCLVHRCFSGLC